MNDRSVQARISYRLYRVIEDARKKHEEETGVGLSFPQACELVLNRMEENGREMKGMFLLK